VYFNWRIEVFKGLISSPVSGLPGLLMISQDVGFIMISIDLSAALHLMKGLFVIGGFFVGLSFGLAIADAHVLLQVQQCLVGIQV